MVPIGATVDAHLARATERPAMQRVTPTALRGMLLDALGVLAVGSVLVGIHGLVPPGVRAEFALGYGQPDPFHALTAAYVHLTDAHLFANVGGLVVVGLWAVLVSGLAGERRWFRLSFLWLLVGLPVAVGLSGAALVDASVTTRGFSGVVAGLVGFALVGIGVVLHRAFGVDRWLAWDAVAATIVVVAAEILWLVAGAVSAIAAGLLLAGVGLTMVPFGRAAIRRGLPASWAEWLRVGGSVVVTAGLVAAVLAFVAGLFPTELARGAGVTNILSHYLGLVYGAVIAGWGYRYWSVAPVGDPSNRRS